MCDVAGDKLNRHCEKIEIGVYSLLTLLLPDGLNGLKEVLSLQQTEVVAEKEIPKNMSLLGLSPVDETEEEVKPGEITKQREMQKMKDLHLEAQLIVEHFNKQNLNCLIRCVRTTLETIKRRVTSPSAIQYGDPSEDNLKIDRWPALKVKLVLSYPQVGLKPPLEEIQSSLNKAVKKVLAVFKDVLQWGQRGLIPGMETSIDGSALAAQSGVLNAPSGVLAAPSGVLGSQSGVLAAQSGVLAAQSGVLSNPSGMLVSKHDPKTFYKRVTDHKEVAKLVSLMGSTISSAKGLVVQTLDQYKEYEHLWVVDRNQHMTAFMESNPTLSDFEAKMKEYTVLDDMLAELDDSVRCGALALATGKIASA